MEQLSASIAGHKASSFLSTQRHPAFRNSSLQKLQQTIFGGNAASLSDRNDPPSLRYGAASSRRFDGRRLGLVGDQLAQERNQHDEHDTDREAAGAELREELRFFYCCGDR